MPRTVRRGPGGGLYWGFIEEEAHEGPKRKPRQGRGLSRRFMLSAGGCLGPRVRHYRGRAAVAVTRLPAGGRPGGIAMSGRINAVLVRVMGRMAYGH